MDLAKLKTLGLVIEHQGKWICSNAGVILFGTEDVRKETFPNIQVRCARFKGEDKVHFIDQLDVDGSILEAIDEVLRFIQRNTKLSSKIKKIQRIDIPEYSSEILREVLINALVHADYSLSGGTHKVSIFSDRLEVESPGMLPFGYLLEDFFSGVSHIRNKVIARTFRELKLMEEWGTGYKRIQSVCKNESYPIPKWEEIGPVIRVTLWPHEASLIDDSEHVQDVSIQKEIECTPRQKSILLTLKNHKPLTTKQLYQKLEKSLSVSERTLRSDLSTLKEAGMVKMIGKGPSTQWTVYTS